MKEYENSKIPRIFLWFGRMLSIFTFEWSFDMENYLNLLYDYMYWTLYGHIQGKKFIFKYLLKQNVHNTANYIF